MQQVIQAMILLGHGDQRTQSGIKIMQRVIELLFTNQNLQASIQLRQRQLVRYFEMNSDEELFGVGITVLSRISNVAALLKKERGHGGDDAGLVRAAETECVVLHLDRKSTRLNSSH